MSAGKASLSFEPTLANDESNNDLTAYLGHIVNPIDANTYSDFKDGALLVNANGVIVAIGHWTKLSKEKISRVFDFGKRLITPGFVDLHLHLPQLTEVGKSGHGLLAWLEKYIFPAEAAFQDEKHAATISNLFFDELARNGTTLAVVFTTIHPKATDIAFKAAAVRGCRVIMGKVMMDTNCPQYLSEESSLSLLQSEELCRQWHGHDNGRLIYAFTPRFALTASANLLIGTSQLWSKYHGSYLQTHLAETPDEVALVLRQFPNSLSYVDVYNKHGLLGQNAIFAHAIYIDDNDLKLLADTDSSLAHCPSSNLFLKSGTFPYKKVKTSTVRFGLGSDVAAGPNISLMSVMKDASYAQSNVFLTPTELFYRATLGGAQALNLDYQVGNLNPGKDADFVVIDPSLRSCIGKAILDQPTDDVLSSLVYLGDDRMIVSTFVRGRPIYQAQSMETFNRCVSSRTFDAVC